jgi:hypothetical protein
VLLRESSNFRAAVTVEDSKEAQLQIAVEIELADVCVLHA